MRSSWPIIVGGCHRSGTSLVRRILDAHSRIQCGPEVKFFRDFYGEYPDDPLAPYRFARTARALVPEDELLGILGRAFVDAHVRAAARAGKARWADKAPENVRYAADWQQLLGDEWLMVHVVRNPLDTLASMREAGFPLTFPADLDGCIDFYREYTEAGLAFGEHEPGRYRLLVYEALVASPAEALSGLMAWLGETFEPEQLSFNGVPHEQGLEDPKISETDAIHAGSVGRWRAALSDEDAARVWARTRDLWARIDLDGRVWRPDRLP